jgi:uncharacterized membrane protein YedE/YeeE
MTEFTPLEALIGGGLIGLAATLLMAVHGRIAGISGALGGLLPPALAPDWRWRAALLSGMAASPVLYWLVLGEVPTLQIEASNGLLLVSGIIVGIGVTYGSGCTSGHGVCGLARLSPRSIAATLTFMATAAATVFLARHVIGA